MHQGAKMSINQEALKKLRKARTKMLLRLPFFGKLATHLKLVEAEWIPTIGTDSTRIYYNPDFINALAKDEIVFVLAHNVMHCVYNHHGRRSGRDKKVWDSACDYVTNNELIDLRIGKMPNLIRVLHDKKYDDKTAEEVYDDLMKEQKQKQNQQGQGDGDGQGEGSAPGSFDEHFEPNKGKAGAKEEGSEEEGGAKSDGQVIMTDPEYNDAQEQFKQAVLAAAKSAKNAGEVPAGIRRMIKALTKPKMDWRELLAAQIKSCVPSDYLWERGSRKTRSLGIHMPDMDREERVEVCVAIDTSGSISEQMLRDFLGEVKGIMEQFTDFEIQIWTFDTSVYNRQCYTPANIDDLLEYDIQGGGGTDFMANWEFMKQEEIEPNRFIMMTDGYPWNSWGDEDYCETIFLIHGNDSIEAPFGITCYYEE